MKGLNVRPETIKIQEENISSIPFDRSLSSFFLGGGDMSPQARKTKAKNWMGFHPTQNFYTVKEPTQKMKGLPTELEKPFAKDTCIKRSVVIQWRVTWTVDIN